MADVFIGLYSNEELEEMCRQNDAWLNQQRALLLDETSYHQELPPSDEGGQHKDEGKQRYDLIPQAALDAEADVMTYGAKKYGPANYQKGLYWMRLFASTLRHLYAWRRKIDKDTESGLDHLAHARCCIGMLMALAYSHPELDDR